MPFQIAAVERPLISVTQLGDSGHETVMGKNGGTIVHTATGRRIPLKRENGVYILEMRVPKGKGKQEEMSESAASGFTRPVAP